MSVAVLTLPKLPERKAPFGKINLDLDEFGFDELPKCGQRLIIFLYKATNFATEPVRLTSAQIAAMCHRSRSWVEKAIAAICDRVVETADGEKHDAPIARRYRVYGTRDKAGRVLEFVADWAKSLKPKVKPAGLAGAMTRTTTRSKAGNATLATAASDPVPEEPCSDPRTPAEVWAEIKAKAAADEAAKPGQPSAAEIDRRIHAAMYPPRCPDDSSLWRSHWAGLIELIESIPEHKRPSYLRDDLAGMKEWLAEWDAPDVADDRSHPARE
jgi:hypothetical protein